MNTFLTKNNLIIKKTEEKGSEREGLVILNKSSQKRDIYSPPPLVLYICIGKKRFMGFVEKSMNTCKINRVRKISCMCV